MIIADGEDRAADTDLKIEQVLDADPADIRQQVRAAGIVGLGGAGFPSAVKLNPGPDRQIELLVINGAECEPFISCDEALMCCCTQDVIDGIRIMQHALNAQQVVIGVEDNMPESHRLSLQGTRGLWRKRHPGCAGSRLYPAGGEKQLIYAFTGEEVPSQGLPADLGIVCHNVGTAAAISRALGRGEPLISRVVTVTGAGVAEPCNLEVRIGTPIADLIADCGGYTQEVARLLMGGPMMGISLAATTCRSPKPPTACSLRAVGNAAPTRPPVPAFVAVSVPRYVRPIAATTAVLARARTRV